MSLLHNLKTIFFKDIFFSKLVHSSFSFRVAATVAFDGGPIYLR